MLLTTSSVEEADRAYWQIDNCVVVQQLLFEAAIPTSACLVKILPACSPVARSRVIELIGQIATGVPDRTEAELGRDNLRQECLAFIIDGVGHYKEILVSGDEIERLYCLDILESCAEAFPERHGEIILAMQLAARDRSLPRVADEAERRLRNMADANKE